MRNFRYFFREGVGNMLSHGFMSFAGIGVTVACLLIMGTFSLVAYNANINLQDLQKENAVVAFVDESLTDEEAQGLQSQLSGISGVADCTAPRAGSISSSVTARPWSSVVRVRRAT